MKILISVLLLVFVFNAVAAEGTRIECHGQGMSSNRPVEFMVLATMTSGTISTRSMFINCHSKYIVIRWVTRSTAGRFLGQPSGTVEFRSRC